MNSVIIKTKKEMIYGENVHKHTKIMKTSKWVNIIFGWIVRNTRFVKFLNDKILKNQEFKGQPQDVVKLHEEIRTLKTTLAKFVNGTDNLNKLLGYYRSSSEKSRNGYDGKVYVHDKDTIVCYFCGKTGHMTSRCRDQPKKGTTYLYG